MDTQVAYVKDRFQSLFALIDELARNAPPPAKNAANGYFREAMWNDPRVNAALQPAAIELSGPALALHNVYLNFAAGMHGSFVHGNHNAHALTYLPIPGEIFNATKEEVIAFVGAVWSLFSGSQEESDEQKQDFFEALGKLLQAVKASGIVTNGTHANGWISVSVHNAAQGILGTINPELPGGGDDEDVAKIVGVLRAACASMLGLRTDNHKPWLRADWQLKFQAICGAAWRVLATIN